MDSTTNIRIKELRKNQLNLSQEKFGAKLGITKTAISRIEAGVNNVTERLLLSICREFNVREDWLRNGTGEIFEKMSGEEKVASLLGKIFTDKDSEIYDFRMSVFRGLAKLEEKDWEVIEKLVDEIIKG